MIGIRIQEESLRRTLRNLRDIAAKIQDRRAVNKAISVEFQNFVFKNFQTEGGMTEEGAWAPLAESTLAWKEARGYRMILQNTGDLRNSFAGFYDNDRAGVGAQKLTGTYDANEPKGGRTRKGTRSYRPPDLAAVHEFGSADGRIPSRPMLPTEAQALAIGMRVYGVFVEGATKR